MYGQGQEFARLQRANAEFASERAREHRRLLGAQEALEGMNIRYSNQLREKDTLIVENAELQKSNADLRDEVNVSLRQLQDSLNRLTSTENERLALAGREMELENQLAASNIRVEELERERNRMSTRAEGSNKRHGEAINASEDTHKRRPIPGGRGLARGHSANTSKPEGDYWRPAQGGSGASTSVVRGNPWRSTQGARGNHQGSGGGGST